MIKSLLSSKKFRSRRQLWWVLAAALAVVLAIALLARHAYDTGLGPVSNNEQIQIFTVDKGSSVKEIAADLEEAKLIKSAWAFQVYVRGRDSSQSLQAGTYALSPSHGTIRIVGILTKGRVATRLVTILPGRRIDQVRADLINSGFSPGTVDQALDPNRYADLPVLAYKPAEVHSLEGLLWPDSYQKQTDTDPAVIIRASLVAMGEHLTPEIRAAFEAQGLSTYQGVSLASIVLQEISQPADQAMAAQVFYARLKSGRLLESDATAPYGAVLAGRPPNITYDSPYNTYLHPGLPPTPIGTVSTSSLEAAAYPASTNWLYFVSGDDGKTYFSTNLKDHEELTRKHCHKLCGP